MVKKWIKTLSTILLSGFGMWVFAGLWHNLILPSLYEDTHATHEGTFKKMNVISFFIT